MTSRTAAACLTIALVSTGGGCGGSSKEGSRSSSSASFLTRANRICREKGFASAHGRTLESRDLPSLTSIATARARTARELSALNPPSALMIGYRRLVSVIAHEAELLRRLADYARDGNDAAFLATHRALRSHAVSHQALLVGLARCA
jgi:hypothetical protein